MKIQNQRKFPIFEKQKKKMLKWKQCDTVQWSGLTDIYFIDWVANVVNDGGTNNRHNKKKKKEISQHRRTLKDKHTKKKKRFV